MRGSALTVFARAGAKRPRVPGSPNVPAPAHARARPGEDRAALWSSSRSTGPAGAADVISASVPAARKRSRPPAAVGSPARALLGVPVVCAPTKPRGKTGSRSGPETRLLPATRRRAPEGAVFGRVGPGAPRDARVAATAMRDGQARPPRRRAPRWDDDAKARLHPLAPARDRAGMCCATGRVRSSRTARPAGRSHREPVRGRPLREAGRWGTWRRRLSLRLRARRRCTRRRRSWWERSPPCSFPSGCVDFLSRLTQWLSGVGDCPLSAPAHTPLVGTELPSRSDSPPARVRCAGRTCTDRSPRAPRRLSGPPAPCDAARKDRRAPRGLAAPRAGKRVG